MVFQLVSRPRPKIRFGLAHAGILAVIFGVWAAIDVPFKEAGSWLRTNVSLSVSTSSS